MEWGCIHSERRRQAFWRGVLGLDGGGGGGGYGSGLVYVVVFGVAVALWEAPLRLVTQHYSDYRTMGDGRRASPSCRP